MSNDQRHHIPRPPPSGRTLVGPPAVGLPRLPPPPPPVHTADDRTAVSTPPGGFELDMASIDDMGPKAAVMYLAGQLSELRSVNTRLEGVARTGAGHAEHGWQLASSTAERITALTETVAALTREVNGLAAGQYVLTDRIREAAEAVSQVRAELAGIYTRLGSVERNSAAAHFAAQKAWQASTAARADLTKLNESIERMVAKNAAELADARRIAAEAKAEAEEAREAGEVTGQRYHNYMERRISEVDGLELERAKADLWVKQETERQRIAAEAAERAHEVAAKAARAAIEAKAAEDERSHRAAKRAKQVGAYGALLALATAVGYALIDHFLKG